MSKGKPFGIWQIYTDFCTKRLKIHFGTGVKKKWPFGTGGSTMEECVYNVEKTGKVASCLFWCYMAG